MLFTSTASVGVGQCGAVIVLFKAEVSSSGTIELTEFAGYEEIEEKWARVECVARGTVPLGLASRYMPSSPHDERLPSRIGLAM